MECVVQIGTLAEFCAEIPSAGPVRLNLTERSDVTDGRFQIPYKEIVLSLQGINPRNEIIWLVWSYRFDFPDDEFMNRKGNSVYRLMPDMRAMVETWLRERTYEVLTGQYALPNDVSLMRGSFECVRFVQDGDEGYRLEAVE